MSHESSSSFFFQIVAATLLSWGFLTKNSIHKTLNYGSVKMPFRGMCGLFAARPRSLLIFSAGQKTALKIRRLMTVIV